MVGAAEPQRGRVGRARGRRPFDRNCHTGEAADLKSATIAIGTPGKGGAGEGDMGEGAAGTSHPTLQF